jgi:hypothetical protein
MRVLRAKIGTFMGPPFCGLPLRGVSSTQEYRVAIFVVALRVLAARRSGTLLWLYLKKMGTI